jgi:VanZ family protein
MRTSLLIIVSSITLFFCLWPNFHSEAMFGWHYHLWVDMMMHSSYFFMASMVILKLVGEKHKLAAFVLMLELAALLEFIQLVIPGRSFSVTDLASNFFGVLLSWKIWEVGVG